MAYLTYDEFLDDYGGTAITELSFLKVQRQAERLIDQYTYRRLADNGLPTSEYDAGAVRHCECRLIEAICELETYKNTLKLSEGKSGVVKSVTAGSESITYASAEGFFAENLKDNGKNLYRSIIEEGLAGICGDDGICLLYGGV